MQISEQIYDDFKRGHIDSLYREGYASMKAFAARYLTDAYAMMAEDCVQDAIVKAYDTRHTFTSPSQFKAFLYTCIRNSCVSVLRKTTSRANYIAQQDTVEEERLSAAIIEQETLDLLRQAISELPEKYRKVFELGYEQGLSYAEAAKQLGITIDGYDKRRARMITLLRKRFKGNEPMLMLISLL
ncbi:MAG: sigma-70 family RNA polymerase sigma factor [Prevotella sp.]|nr:sigma-70 family RNA polymerase sigma factor [Prevotella sp.]